jgi:hypothetical protein
VNTEFTKEEANGGVLDMPAFFVDAKFDATYSPSATPGLGEVRGEFPRDLTVRGLEAGV